MIPEINFKIQPDGIISDKFLSMNILTFSEAGTFVRQIPYGRNKNKADLTCVFTDKCGTCSTKHALLKQLADENGFSEVKLITGIFRMNTFNTPKIATTLKKHQLNHIPEAHNYLIYKNQRFDFTNKKSSPADFIDDLIEEIEINADQITDFKVSYHKAFLNNWLNENNDLNLTIDELWKIREQCIQDLSR